MFDQYHVGFADAARVVNIEIHSSSDAYVFFWQINFSVSLLAERSARLVEISIVDCKSRNACCYREKAKQRASDSETKTSHH